LKEGREKDMRMRTTTIGPHRDDIHIAINGKDVRHFASQGQQRTTALSMKLAELEIFKSATGEAPVLLLDDIFSELDSKRQGRLLEMIGTHQTIITTATPPELAQGSVVTFTIKEGRVI
jgi:DNA replication and repair protein RecF